jgi:NAD(P)-dependent dehydrogenase (short-subunit alcohol dehydrogenase family)
MNQPIALVTGANKGIGLETARQLAQQGMKVIATARNVARGEAALQPLQEAGLDVEFVQLDVNDAGHRQAVVDYLRNHYGKLDILVNNAGIEADGGWMGNSTETVSEDVLRQTFDTNFFSVVLLTQALLPLLKKSNAGRIVNVSSVMGSLSIHANPEAEIYGVKPFAYNASKTALNAFTVHLAQALADTPIKVNSAHPGWVKTDLGTEHAPLDVGIGAQTSVRLATLDQDGPNGGYFHLEQPLPW